MDLGINRRVGRKLHLLMGGGQTERAQVASRPGDAKEIFSRRVRFRKLNVDEAVATSPSAGGTGGSVSLSGE
jgi:hypothetical protein